MDVDDHELRAPAALRHAEALAAHHGFVRSLARGLVAPSAVDDVAQEALLAGLSARIEKPGALRGWLATAVRNVAGKWHRGERRRGEREATAASVTWNEALPSSGELVERIELSQSVVRAVVALREPERTAVLWRFYESRSTAEIAQRLGVPADTVRSRIRRGLDEVRRQLDGSFGTRAAWIALLQPIAGMKPALVASGSAAAASISGTIAATGVVTMTLKTSMTLVALSATAVVAWLVVPNHWIDRALGAPPKLAVGRGSDVARPQPDLANAANATSGLPLAAERSLLDPATAGGDPNATPAVALPPPGHVAFRVLDAGSGQPIENVRVRFLREQRFAEYAGGGEVNACLTSGAWDGNVAATGYEPARLEAFDIHVGETTQLGTLLLSRGSGAIEGVVVARHLPAETPVLVQLFGDGRSRCDRCRQRSDAASGEAVVASAPDDVPPDAPQGACCGFADGESTFTVRGDRRFRFPALAAGVYWLRAFDEAQRIVAAERIELARSGTAWKRLDVTPPTRARFELRHDGGGALSRSGLFTGDWASIHRERAAPIHFTFRRDGKDVGGTECGPERDDVRATMGEPLLLHREDDPSLRDLHASSWSFVNFFSSLTFTGMSVGDERLDRERVDGDGLAFDCPEPGISNAALTAERVRADLFEVGPLPRLALTVVVTCGHYTSPELPLDLRNEQFAPLVVPLGPTEEWSKQLVEIAKGPPDSCVACHGEQAPTKSPPTEQSIFFGEIGAGGGELRPQIRLNDGTMEISFGSLGGSSTPSLPAPDPPPQDDSDQR